MSFTLSPKTFLSSVAASIATEWFLVDFRFQGIQERSIQGTKVSAASDTVHVELRTDGLDSQGATTTVITTATSWAGSVTNFSAVIRGPFQFIRIRKEGAGGAATVVGIV